MDTDDLCDAAVIRAAKSVELADRLLRYELSQPSNLPHRLRRPIIAAEWISWILKYEYIIKYVQNQ